MAKEESSEASEEPVILMMVTQPERSSVEIWYIDSGCSNHMTGHREWLVDLDERKKSIVRFANNRVIQAEGAGNVVVTKQDGKQAIISDVLYVPGMKSNLISLGQLLEKGYSVRTVDNLLEVCDAAKKTVIKVPLARNKTFKVSLNKLDTQCFSAAVYTDEFWLWHLRMGHLNFRDLSRMRFEKLVSGLPLIKTPVKVCENFWISKQSRTSFSNFTTSRSSEILQVVYSDVCGPFEVPHWEEISIFCYWLMTSAEKCGYTC